MDILEAIETRKSIGKMKQDPIEPKQIERLLELGVRAPNHHHTNPWRFIVMTGEGRNTLGDAYADIALEKVSTDIAEADRERILDTQHAKARRAPVVIAVATSFSSDDEIQCKEDRAATAAAIENMLLAAHGLGLGGMWRTGAPVYHPRMKQAFKLGDNEELVGLVFIGYPDISPMRKERKPVSEITTWLT